MQALGFVRDAAEVWGFGGRFVGRRFAAKGVWIFDVTLKRPLVAEERRPKSTNPDPDSRPRPRRFGPSRRGRAWGVNFVVVSHCSVT